MNRDEFLAACEAYCQGKDFKLNPDKDFLNRVIDGVMVRQKETGLRYCPCRLGDEVELLCPCYFQALPVWKEKGMCWCGLFVKS